MSRLCSVLIAVVLGGVVVAGQPPRAHAADCSPVSEEGELDHTPWGQARMNAERAWPVSRGDGVTVAVIDSGVSDAHPVLAGKVDFGKDYVEPEEGESKLGADCDLVGHGTSIAGIIAGRQDPGSPFVGMAPDADLLSIRILPDLGVSRNRDLPDDIAAAIREAADSGADVINLSVQVVASGALEDAVNYAADKGVVLVAAAGNHGGEDDTNQPQYPAAYDNDALLAVASMGREGVRTSSSNTGDYVDLAAPGEEIIGPGPKGEGFTGGEKATGTSFAAAFVSGAAALVRARHPDLSAAEVAERLRATAQSPPHLYDEQVGYGVVDPYRAVTADLTKTGVSQDMAGPRMGFQADRQADPGWIATILLGGSIGFAVIVMCWRAVVPVAMDNRARRKRVRRRQ